VTWDRRLYFPSEGRRAEDFYRPEKSWRLRPGLNPQTWVIKARTLSLDHQSRFIAVTNWLMSKEVPHCLPYLKNFCERMNIFVTVHRCWYSGQQLNLKMPHLLLTNKCIQMMALELWCRNTLRASAVHYFLSQSSPTCHHKYVAMSRRLVLILAY